MIVLSSEASSRTREQCELTDLRVDDAKFCVVSSILSHSTSIVGLVGSEGEQGGHGSVALH